MKDPGNKVAVERAQSLDSHDVKPVIPKKLIRQLLSVWIGSGD